MAGYKRYYIPIGAFLVTLFTILQIWGLQIIDQTGDINCSEECISYFNVRNPTSKSIYIYNYQDVKLDFSPDIKDYKLYVKYYGKWVHTNFTNSTRLGNIPKDRKYAFVFPRYSTKEFKLVGHKEATQTIKWGFGFEENYLDPVWIGDEKPKPIDCKDTIIYWDESEDEWDWIEKNYTCDDIINATPEVAMCWDWNINTSQYSISFEKFNYTNIDINDKFIEWKIWGYIGKKIITKNKTECIKTGYVVLPNGTIISYEGMWCQLSNNDKFIVCVADNVEGLTGGEGGRWSIKQYEIEDGFTYCKPDGSITCWEEEIDTGKITFKNSLHMKLKHKEVSLNEVS